jgi:hypothetical protein
MVQLLAAVVSAALLLAFSGIHAAADARGQTPSTPPQQAPALDGARCSTANARPATPEKPAAGRQPVKCCASERPKRSFTLTAGGMRPFGGRRAAASAGPSPSTVWKTAVWRRHGFLGRAVQRARRLHDERLVAGLERLVADGHQHAVPVRGRRRPDGRRPAQAVVEMGLRLPRRDLGVVAADRRRRPPVRRQPERHRLFARRGERLHSLDVQRAKRRAYRGDHRTSRRRRSLRLLR